MLRIKSLKDSKHTFPAKPLRSVLVRRDSISNNSRPTNNDVKSKKKVTFAPDTIDYSREQKQFKYHNFFKAKRESFLNSEFPKLRFGTPITTNPSPSTSRNKPNPILTSDLVLLNSSSNKMADLLTKQLTAYSSKMSSESDNTAETHLSMKQRNKQLKRQQQLLELQQRELEEEKLAESKKQEHNEQDEEETEDDSNIENDYVSFTHARKTYDYMSKRCGPSAIRAKRLFQIGEELRTAHRIYNSLKSTESRDNFLLDEIIIRYIMGLDLALTENYTGFALELTHAMADITNHMLPLYSHYFYHPDGSRILLPIVVSNNSSTGSNTDKDGNGANCFKNCDDEDSSYNFIHMIAPVVTCLNRISGDRPRNENQFLCIETLLIKLQLEMIILIISPIKSTMFRAVLEIVSSTAVACFDALLLRTKEYEEESSKTNRSTSSLTPDGSESDEDKVRKPVEVLTQDENPIRWVNNSILYEDYVNILRSIGLADKIGCLSHVPGISFGSSTNQPQTRKSPQIPAPVDINNNSAESENTSTTSFYDRTNSTLRAFSPMNMHDTNL